MVYLGSALLGFQTRVVVWRIAIVFGREAIAVLREAIAVETGLLFSSEMGTIRLEMGTVVEFGGEEALWGEGMALETGTV